MRTLTWAFASLAVTSSKRRRLRCKRSLGVLWLVLEVHQHQRFCRSRTVFLTVTSTIVSPCFSTSRVQTVSRDDRAARRIRIRLKVSPLVDRSFPVSRRPGVECIDQTRIRQRQQFSPGRLGPPPPLRIRTTRSPGDWAPASLRQPPRVAHRAELTRWWREGAKCQHWPSRFSEPFAPNTDCLPR